ncbi:uncharacterized protein [Prorops nasuta]|uniref:uncharacterized protein n=1 Tax=Prorops nasuta TaxID=863751 RepID=UPI0034CDDE67
MEFENNIEVVRSELLASDYRAYRIFLFPITASRGKSSVILISHRAKVINTFFPKIEKPSASSTEHPAWRLFVSSPNLLIFDNRLHRTKGAWKLERAQSMGKYEDCKIRHLQRAVSTMLMYVLRVSLQLQ